MEQMVYVKWESNWADEMDVFGSSVMTITDYNDMMYMAEKVINSHNGEYEIYVGTNESIYYDTFDDFNADVSIEAITNSEYDSLMRLKLDETGQSNIIEYWYWLEQFDEKEEERLDEEEEMITITKEEYNALIRTADFLSALEMAGIDNAMAYEYGQELFRQYFPQYFDENGEPID